VAGDLPHRPRPVRLNDASPAPVGAVSRTLATAPPEALFLLSAIGQYAGAVVAVSIFDEVAPATVAWFRVIGAAVVLLVLSGPALRRHGRWTGPQLAAAATFGVATAAMNLTFYLAIERLDLGKGVAIEFVGPILVAALRTRSRRNGIALLAATAGVLTLTGVEVDDNLLGLVYIFLASAMWALYIVFGARVARVTDGAAGLGVGLAVGAAAIAPFGLADAATVLAAPRLLGLCVLVGVLSNVVGYGIDQYTLRRIPVRRFSLLLALLPVTATLFGVAFLDQTPSRIDLLGIALVLVGVAVQQRETLAT
jgi:inner membrane transporter RhtA